MTKESDHLLDTHAFLWWITDDSRLPSNLIKHLEQLRETMYVSIASLWEIVLKYQLGKLQIPEPVEPFLMRQITENHLELLPIQAHHIFQTLSLPALHRDPFDRLLVSQAQADHLILITSDTHIKAYAVETLWDIPDIP